MKKTSYNSTRDLTAKRRLCCSTTTVSLSTSSNPAEKEKSKPKHSIQRICKIRTHRPTFSSGIYWLFILTFLGLTAQAQELNIFVGTQATGITSGSNWNSQGGVYGGFYSNIRVSTHFYLQPGISFSQKGYKGAALYRNGYAIDEVRANYLEAPLLIAFRIPIVSKYRFMAAAGPYFSLGVGGRRSYFSAESSKNTETFSSGFLRRFDYGLFVKLAVELNRVVLSSSFSIGEPQLTGNITYSIFTVGFRLFDFSRAEVAVRRPVSKAFFSSLYLLNHSLRYAVVGDTPSCV